MTLELRVLSAVRLVRSGISVQVGQNWPQVGHQVGQIQVGQMKWDKPLAVATLQSLTATTGIVRRLRQGAGTLLPILTWMLTRYSLILTGQRSGWQTE